MEECVRAYYCLANIGMQCLQMHAYLVSWNSASCLHPLTGTVEGMHLAGHARVCQALSPAFRERCRQMQVLHPCKGSFKDLLARLERSCLTSWYFHVGSQSTPGKTLSSRKLWQDIPNQLREHKACTTVATIQRDPLEALHGSYSGRLAMSWLTRHALTPSWSRTSR